MEEAAAPNPEESAPAERKPRVCFRCKREITDYFYTYILNDVCVVCHRDIEKERSEPPNPLRILYACLLGAVAALAGAVLNWIVLMLPYRERYLVVVIAVGFFVGLVCRYASKNRGSWRYQVIAVVLTYVSIAAANVPIIGQSLEIDRPPFGDDPIGRISFLFRLLPVAAKYPFYAFRENVVEGILAAMCYFAALAVAWAVTGSKLDMIAGPYPVDEDAVIAETSTEASTELAEQTPLGEERKESE